MFSLNYIAKYEFIFERFSLHGSIYNYLFDKKIPSTFNFFRINNVY